MEGKNSDNRDKMELLLLILLLLMVKNSTAHKLSFTVPPQTSYLHSGGRCGLWGAT